MSYVRQDLLLRNPNYCFEINGRIKGISVVNRCYFLLFPIIGKEADFRLEVKRSVRGVAQYFRTLG